MKLTKTEIETLWKPVYDEMAHGVRCLFDTHGIKKERGETMGQARVKVVSELTRAAFEAGLKAGIRLGIASEGGDPDRADERNDDDG